MSLERFIRAQDDGFEEALSELRAGRKTGHWIWYVFPQISGLGISEMSRIYGIEGPDEAAAYLRDPVLRDRLLKAATTVADQLRAGVKLSQLMGSSIDVLKLVSSMTLFSITAGRLQDREIAKVADAILQAAEAQGHPPCKFTQQTLSQRS